MRPQYLIPGNWKYLKLSDHEKFVKENPGVWIDKLEKLSGGNIYGGFLEDRSSFFDERHDPKLNIHVGVDLWSPAGTKITFPYETTVRFARIASKTRGGWGGRLDLQYYDRVFILGHLVAPEFREGSIIPAGKIVGELADRENNGGWLPHLHIQEMDADFYDLWNDKNDIDAYASDHKFLEMFYFDPFKEYEILLRQQRKL